ncbi:nuclear transport factor 2 family protein [Streptomyces fungicidicus]|uniref:nuclear transport factor 2 family protein n=1 Tax=Streptomyces fungicidicus TaxID=68203 RepID=UPI0038195255
MDCTSRPTLFIDEVVNEGCLDALDQLWADDMIWRGDSLVEHRGTDAYRKFMAAPCRRGLQGQCAWTSSRSSPRPPSPRAFSACFSISVTRPGRRMTEHKINESEERDNGGPLDSRRHPRSDRPHRADHRREHRDRTRDRPHARPARGPRHPGRP